jgi:3-oxoadipate enol-lactonase
MPIVKITNGPDINLVRAGPTGGVPIVFIHALGLDLTLWEHQLQEFGHDNDVIAFDLPGHGLSGDMDAPPTFTSMARIVAGVLTHLNAGLVHLVGLSVGGMIAQTLAVTSPQMVRSLSLVATSCTFPDTVRKALRERARVAREGGMEAIAPLHLERWFPPEFRTKRPYVLDRLDKILLRQDREFHAALWDMVATLDVEQRLLALTCPVMVVAGEEDMSASPVAGQLIVNQVAGATLHVVPRAGHFPPLEFPGAFNALLRAFLHRA